MKYFQRSELSFNLRPERSKRGSQDEGRLSQTEGMARSKVLGQIQTWMDKEQKDGQCGYSQWAWKRQVQDKIMGAWMTLLAMEMD